MLTFVAVVFGQCLLAQPTVRVIAEGERWRRANSGSVVRGALIPASEDVLGSAGASELLLDCGPLGWRLYACGGNCKVPVCSGAQAGVTMQRIDPRGAAGLSDSLTAWFKRELKTPVTLGVRGGGSPNDSVVLTEAKGVHWGSALKRVLEGTYCLNAMLLPSSAKQTISIHWDRAVDPEGLASGANLRPGAYQLRKGTSEGGTCKLDADAAPAWVVVAPEASFKKLDAEWKQRSGSLDELAASGVSAATISIVRHALLAGYAETLERP